MAGSSRKALDLAFVMDCTGSMDSYIDSAKSNIIEIVDKIVGSEGVNVRLAFVGYRDHPPEEDTFVTEINDFTTSPSTMKGWLSKMSAEGGGDTPEAVVDGLKGVLGLSWRSHATKIAVLVADAPPHGIGSNHDEEKVEEKEDDDNDDDDDYCFDDSDGDDGFPDGCPCGYDPLTVTGEMAQKGITLYVVGCEPNITSYKPFFMGMAHKTGGQYVPLSDAADLAEVIVGGAKEEMDIERLMDEVDVEVKADIAEGKAIDEADITRRAHAKMTAKGVTSKQLHLNKAELESAVQNLEASTISSLSSIAEMKEHKSKVSSAGGITIPDGDGSLHATLARLTVSSEPAPKLGTGGFALEEKPVSISQTSRLVKKSLARNMVSKKYND